MAVPADSLTDIWTEAPERWVPLKDIIGLVQADFEITPAQAARIIRGELEGATQHNHPGPGIPHEVSVPLAPFPAVARDAARSAGMGDELRVPASRLGGWGEVDWDAGTIKGQVIEIDWPAAQHALRVLGVGRRTVVPTAAGVPDAQSARAKRRGPPRIDYRQSDLPHVGQMHAMISDGQARNPTDAAKALVGKGMITGIGNDGSKVTRLVRHYLQKYPSI